MTRGRRPLSTLALIAAVGVIGACGSAALAGTGRGSNGRDGNARNHETAVEVATARVSTRAPQHGSRPSGSPGSLSAASPAGSTSPGAPTRWLPRQ